MQADSGWRRIIGRHEQGCVTGLKASGFPLKSIKPLIKKKTKTIKVDQTAVHVIYK